MVEFRSRWEDLRPLVVKAERPSRYINREWGAVYKPDADFHFCMVYPDTYELGQPNQALRILVNRVNGEEGMAAERGFLPAAAMTQALRDADLPLCSIESCAPLAAFDVVGITLPHELAATNIYEVLDLAGISLHGADRGEEEPLVIAGGPCALNPEPYYQIFDAFNIGEGEEMLPEGLRLMRKMKKDGASRQEILEAVAALDGWYVPSLYEELSAEQAQEAESWLRPLHENAAPKIVRRVFEGFSESPGWEPCIVPFADIVHDRLDVEVLRGCARGCRFCQAGMMYRPVRERSADNIVASVKEGLRETGYDEVSLISLSTTDHSEIASILQRLNRDLAGRGVRISLPSQRLDSFGVGMAELVAGAKKGGLTFAPEAGTQRLRDVINKNVTEEDLFGAIDAAFAAGWRRCKLYFMIGLPTETDEDIKGIASLVSRAYDHARKAVDPDQRGSIAISASVALFVPKAHTPFQWDGQIPPEEAARRINLLRSSVKYRAISINWHDPKTSFIEAYLSRAGREGAALIEEAWRRGARFDAWSEHFNEEAWRKAAEMLGINFAAEVQRSYEPGYVMPWAHISCGIDAEWLAAERRRAEEGILTQDCTFGPCSACGVCFDLPFGNMLASSRVGEGSHG